MVGINGFIIVSARLLDATNVALWFAGDADIAAVEDEPMVGYGEQLLGEALLQLTLSGQGGLGICLEANAVGHTEAVSIYGHHLPAPQYCPNDICRLATYALQRLQLLRVARHLSAELLDYLT